ncbi:MAG TPA: aminopeptidase N [Jiangellaceae bacterium]
MPGTNLTRDEARDRAAAVDVDGYEIELDLTAGDTTFTSTSTVRFRAADGAATWLDLIAPEVRSVTVNGDERDPAEVYDGARITLDGLAEENEVTVVADAAYMNTGEGLHRFVDPVDGEVYLYSQFQVADARRVFACFEQPDLKATFALRVVTPEHWTVVSNSPTPKPRKAASGKRWRFAPTPRISTYITAIVAGPYHAVHDEYEGRDGKIPLGLYCRRSLAEHLDVSELFDVTKQGFGFFEDAFGMAYPFKKYDQLFVPEFNAGAMENAGCVTHHEDYVFRSRVTDAAYERRAETILHEMAHMWFGDLVTMRWWDDLWLNESFATWASIVSQAEATRWTQAWTSFAVQFKLWALRQDQLPSTHPISADIHDLEDVEVNFDGITYAKGASALKQLVAWVGRDEFLDGIRAYFAEHAWGNTDLANLFAHLEATSGRDLDEWGRLWLQTAGVNTLTPHLTVGEDGTYTAAHIAQTAGDEHPTLRPHRVAIGLYDQTPEGLVRRERVELDVTGERTEAHDLVGKDRADLVLVNDDDLTFAKIRLDDSSLHTLIESIGEFRDGLPRALGWTAATDMLRDAEMPARDYIELVLRGVEHETDMTVVQTVLRAARAAVDLYSDPADRLLLSSRWSSALHRMARSAEPGSDAQLALTRAWVAGAASEAHVEQIRALLATTDGGDVLPGLAVDTDMRWNLIQRLVTIGAAGDGTIDDELERDDTATGRRHAARARASRPFIEAKEDAWTTVVDQDKLPNALLAATVSGFAHPEQRELVRPFVGRYLDAVPRVWAERTNDTAQTIITGLFPRVLADSETADTIRSWLQTADIPDAARRLVVEGLADLDRALTAQACDREAAAHERE